MLLYIICLVVLGLPAMTMEFSVGRAAQASPIRMYQKLEKPGCKWGIFGIASLIGNIALMAFYTVVTGWIIYYFIKFLTGQNADFGFTQMITNPTVNVVFLLVTVVVAFAILSFNLQGGLERITKYMMLALTGTMANNGAVTKTLDTTTTSYTIAKGYHSGSGKVSITKESKSVTPTKSAQTVTPTSGKVLSSVSVAAIPALYVDTTESTTDAASAANILSGKKTWVNGSQVTGTMANNGATSLTIDGLTTLSVAVPAGYTSGGTVSLTDDIYDALAAI